MKYKYILQTLLITFLTNTLKAQIEIESVSTEKPFKIEYDSTLNIPALQNLIGQSFFVLPLKTLEANAGYRSFYTKPDGKKHYLTQSEYQDTPKESLVGRTLEIIGYKVINKGDILREKSFLELKRKDNGDILYWQNNQFPEEVITIGYFEKIKKNLLNKKCYLTNNFFILYNLIQHKEIINQKDIWTIFQIVYDENIEVLVVKLKNSSNELCAAKYSDWFHIELSTLTYIPENTYNEELDLYKENTEESTKPNNSLNESTGEVYTIVEEMPEFPGGAAAMMEWIKDKIESIGYPQMEKEAGISGTCYVTFVIDKEGNVTDSKVLRSVSGGPGYDKVALQVVKAMPKWSAGKQNGRSVSVQYNLPVKF